MADGSGGTLERLLRSFDPGEQAILCDALDGAGRMDDLRRACLVNPFLRLSEAEAESFAAAAAPGSVDSLIAARQAAMRCVAPRYVVFCMPKSGSSFVQSALCEALQAPFVSLTSVGSGGASSYFGMNPREQEIDELALVKSTLAAPQGFVAQHHTRYTQYLGLQIRAFGLTPVVTLRNIFDCLVSFDDMMLSWRAGTRPEDAWVADPYALPRDYVARPPAERYDLLARSLGVWLVQFLLAWTRGQRQGLIFPLVIRYETDILDRDRFVERITGRFRLTQAQRDRLAAYAAAPDPTRSRLNVGTAGRGRERVSDATRQFLVDYAAAFRDEIFEDDLRQLLG
ncbi:MAG: hypothetical protein JSS35_20245 [Proteobacteria bacterium]|nr:hypothetical protein [Pseudomonadota bacterium]